MTTWNGERHLREAIDSALAQDYTPLEVVVVDDGSTDATPDICRSYGERIRYFRQPKDDKRGATAVVRAYAEARGTLLAALDHDDRWLPGKIAAQVATMTARPEIGAVFTRFRIINEDGCDQGASELTAQSGDVFHLLLAGNRFCYSSALFRADALKRVGHHDVDAGIGDWDLWLRIARHYSIIMLDEALTEYRVHNSGYSANLTRMGRATARVLENQRQRLHPNCPDCHAGMAKGMRVVAEAYLQHFHNEARAGRPGVALASLGKALRTSRAAVFNRRQLAATAKSLASAGIAWARPGSRGVRAAGGVDNAGGGTPG